MSAGHKTRVLGLILLWTLATILFVAQPALADATSDAEACFLSKINAARASSGAQQLSRDSTLAGYARIHSKAMADQGSIYHSSTGDLAPYLPGDWMKWGENVGVGGSCSALFDAFWASSSHRENLLDPAYQYAGIGVYIDASSVMWTTHVFLQRASATTTTTAPPPTTTTTAPPATTTTTAPPPTTTTTTHAPTTTTHPPTTTAPPATTTTTAPPPTTTTTAPPATTTTTAPPPSTTTTAASATTSSPNTTAAATTLSTTTTTTQRADSLSSLVGSWESDGVLCSEGRCGGDQALLAFIGVVLLSGSVLTTWSLRG